MQLIGIHCNYDHFEDIIDDQVVSLDFNTNCLTTYKNRTGRPDGGAESRHHMSTMCPTGWNHDIALIKIIGCTFIEHN